MEKTNIDMRTLREILEDYCKRGWFLFPIKRETKRPAIYNNLEDASNNIKELLDWEKQFPNCNWGLSLAKSGLVAVDVDEAGLDHWMELEFEHSEPETLKAQSGSGIGFHFIFKAEKGTRYRGKIVKGIDVKHNGYVAIYPSIHPKTKAQYIFLNDTAPAKVPAWLGKLIHKKVEEKKADAPKYDLGNRFYAKIIEQLQEKEFGYEEWLRMGMALHAAFGGSDEGLEFYLALTQGQNYKEGDLEKARDKWNGFRSDNSGISGGTFVHLARKLGCEIPNPDLDSDLELFKEAQESEEDKFFDERDEVPQWKTDADGQTYSVHKKFIIDELNQQYAVLTGSGKGSIIHFRTDDLGEKHVHVLKPDRFRTALAPLHYKEIIERRGIPVKFKFHGVANIWLKSDFRQTFEDIVFEPNPKGNVFNLWTGIPCKAIEGDVSLATGFIEEIICGGDKNKAAYLLDWLAHIMQKPEEKSITVPTLIGDQGTGKGLFTDGLLRGILKTRYIRIDKPGVIMERFNVEQSKKFVTVLDEASWRGNHELANVMKSLTGNDTMTVEEKHGGRYAIKNYSRYLITSNEKEAVFLEPTNRRYLVLELSSLNIRDLDYYGRIWGQLENNNLAEHFFDFLMKRDISKFNPKRFPVELDNLGQDTKVSSMGAVGAYWYDGLFENPQPMFSVSNGPSLQKEIVYEAFLDYCNKTRQWQKGLSRQKFWRESKNLIPLLDARETRYQNGDGQFHRVIRAYPHEIAANFCTRNRLNMPESFDELELINEGDFKDDAPEINN